MKQKTLLLAASLCGFALSSQASLVAWYKFDEDLGATTALDAVAGGTDGTIGSEVTTGFAGISGNAYSFAGTNAADSVVNMGNANFLSSINLTGQLTFSAWVKTTDTTGNRNTVVSAGSTVDYRSYADIGVSNTAGHLGEATARNRPAGAGDASAQATGVFSDGKIVNDDSWHQIVMTVNTSTSEILLYVDGSLWNSQTMTTSALPIFDYFQVGRLTRNNSTTGSSVQNIDPYTGLIDDVQIYDTALSASEVQFLFENPGVAVPEPGTVALVGLGLGLVGFSARRKRA